MVFKLLAILSATSPSFVNFSLIDRYTTPILPAISRRKGIIPSIIGELNNPPLVPRRIPLRDHHPITITTIQPANKTRLHFKPFFSIGDSGSMASGGTEP